MRGSATVRDSSLNEAFRTGATEEEPWFLVGLESNEMMKAVKGFDAAVAEVRRLLPLLESNDRVILELKDDKVTTHDHAVGPGEDEDIVDAEVVSVERD